MTTHTYDFSIDCPLPAETVFGTMSDFSDMRPKYFPNLSRTTYEVIERNGTTALVQEGSGPFRNKERYNWSAPGRIWSVVVDSTVLAPGCLTDIRIEPTGQRSCQVLFHLEREFVGGRGRLLYVLVLLNGGKRFFRRTYLRMLKNVQRIGWRR